MKLYIKHPNLYGSDREYKIIGIERGDNKSCIVTFPDGTELWLDEDSENGSPKYIDIEDYKEGDIECKKIIGNPHFSNKLLIEGFEIGNYKK